ncbi:cytochrome P450 family protein [Actinacidiphila oryziradicis]|uniref:Cytochrome P450 n=1 Tax=Actinacidiphila oryziradicis TaxID=2571141 RepID=A0A4U0SMP6_9ACTN|nr:cytochrome P450 [Actinacidiphila oryziradicis]TKA11052.1 cytochrome P450 [Actinacidiphila oryziradicis]
METVDLRSYGGQFTADPYPVYAELRARGPVHRVHTPDAGDLWLVVGHDEARAALADPRLAKDPRVINGNSYDEEFFGPHMLLADPPRHTRLRRLVAREFTPRRVEALRPRIQEITDGLVDAMVSSKDGGADGRADLVEALAFPLPITVICELLGVPDLDRASFRAWSSEAVAPTGAEAELAAFTQMSAYLDELIEDKRRSPGDDLMSGLIRTTGEDGDRLSTAELRGMAYLLLIAGHETTVNLISNGVRALLSHPGQLAALRADFSLLDGAVEEMLRYDGPVETSTFRFTARPVEIGGTVIPAHERVLVALASADRDPARFADPDRFDIRRDTRGHVAFGHGPHFCLGAPLARVEGRIAVRTLLERCPDLVLAADPGELDWLPGMLIRGVRSLPVGF